MKIYVETPLNAAQKEKLMRVTNNDTVIFRDELTEDKQLEALRDADIIFGNPRAEWLELAGNCKWLQFSSTGFEYYKGVNTKATVTNMDDFFSQPCAETMVAGIMALYRKIDRFAVLKERKEWVGAPIRKQLQLLNRKKVIILGTGNIGRHVAKILSGFDADILFFGRTAADAAMRTKEELEANIAWADIIIGCLPGTEQTRGLFTKSMIDEMKPGALFCNVGRGNLLEDEGALVDALFNGRIGGAVLDVTASEPIAPDSKIWHCPNTILTQHSGGGQSSEYDGILDTFLENLENFRKGHPLKNEVNLRRGY